MYRVYIYEAYRLRLARRLSRAILDDYAATLDAEIVIGARARALAQRHFAIYG